MLNLANKHQVLSSPLLQLSNSIYEPAQAYKLV